MTAKGASPFLWINVRLQSARPWQVWHPFRGAGSFSRRGPEVAAPKSPRRPPATLWQPFGLEDPECPNSSRASLRGAGLLRQEEFYRTLVPGRRARKTLRFPGFYALMFDVNGRVEVFFLPDVDWLWHICPEKNCESQPNADYLLGKRARRRVPLHGQIGSQR